MRGSRINRCVHCGSEFVGSACVIGVTCPECKAKGHTDSLSINCPLCHVPIDVEKLLQLEPLPDTIRTRFLRIRRRRPEERLEFQIVVCNGAGKELAYSAIMSTWRMEDALTFMMKDPKHRDPMFSPAKLEVIRALADVEEYLNLVADRQAHMWR